LRTRPVGVGCKCREFFCHTAAQHHRHHTWADSRGARRTVERRRRDGESVVHQMITERQDAGMQAGPLGDQHHTGTLALAVPVVCVSRRCERRDGPSGQVCFRCGHAVSVFYLAGSGDWVCVAAASVRYSSVPAAPVIAMCAGPPSPFSRVVHTGSARLPSWPPPWYTTHFTPSTSLVPVG